MAKVKLTKMNFSSILKEKVDNMGVEGIFMSSLLGGREKLKIQQENNLVPKL